MTQEKMRKIITACVSAGTLLLVVLLSVLIYQWIKIGVLNNRIENLTETKIELEEKIENAETDLDYYESVMGKEWLAFENGFVRPSQGE